MSDVAVLPENKITADVQAEPTVLLVGHPNVGKSVLFHGLTQKYVIASNYSGTTVAVTRGSMPYAGKQIVAVDTPGVHSLHAAQTSEDEKATRRMIISAKNPIVVQVAEAKNLHRSLLLTAELAELRIPMILVLNMMDEATQAGLTIDIPKLSKALSIPVLMTVATKRQGIDGIAEQLPFAAVPRMPQVFEKPAVSIICDNAIHQLVDQVLTRKKSPTADLKVRAGNLMMHPLWGVPFFCMAMYFMYQFVGVFGAGTLVNYLEKKVFGAYMVPALAKAFTAVVPLPFFHDLLFGEYGVISMGLTYSLAIVLPIVFTFFLAFALFEDSGYLPRLTILSNRLFKYLGLNGKAILPMVLGLGCATMATMTTRILQTKRERFIATLLLAVGVPCSAQLGVVLGITAAIGSWAVFTVLGIVLMQLCIVGFCANLIMPGKPSALVMEMAPIRLPKLLPILKKTWYRMRWFTREVVPLFLWATLGLFIFDKVGLLKLAERILMPVVQGVLGLPGAATPAFVMGFLRRDYGSAGFFRLFEQGQLTVLQTVVSLVVITLFIPCVAHFLMMIKEQGRLRAMGISVFVVTYAVFIGWLVRQVGMRLV